MTLLVHDYINNLVLLKIKHWQSINLEKESFMLNINTNLFSKTGRVTASLLVVLMGTILLGCSRNTEPSKKQELPSVTTSRGEHNRDSNKHSGEAGEESGTEFALDETYDFVRNGVRLILAYDKESNSFNGTVENTTVKTLKRVRVEVHLSNGVELGPTKSFNLGPGSKRSVMLTASERQFEGWSAHPEVGGGEEGHGEERGEHSREGHGEERGEHD